ncbi:MAG: class D sortase [Acidobacteria bacterium]|nr:class D sortase [Acidobacteriota bacterium]
MFGLRDPEPQQTPHSGLGLIASHLRVDVLRWLETSLLLVAILSIGWYAGVRITMIVRQAHDNRTLERLVADREAGTRSTDLEPAAPVTTTVRGADTEAALPAFDSVIGRLEVPRLGIAVVVREGTEPDTLRYAVGHISETALPDSDGNAAIAGHRDTFFRKLKEIRAGDRVVMTMPDRKVTYLVRDTRVVPPTEMSVLDHTPQPTLTLVTCYPFNYIGAAPDRFVVRAVADRFDIADAQPRLPSKPVAALSIPGLALLPPSPPTLAPFQPIPSGSSSKRRLGAVAKKTRANATRLHSKKGRGPENSARKRGFWRTLGRIFTGR